MKLLLLNGNTDAAITERLATEARAMCGHAIIPATARFGARYIASRAAAAIAGHAVLDALAEHVGPANPAGYDAVLIACFGDPGLEAARELSPIPVLGMAEASIAAARRLAPRIALLTGGAAWVPMLEEFARLRGLGPDQVRVAAVQPTGDMIARDPGGALALLAEAARAEIAAGAGAVVLGGAGLVGLAPRLRPLLPVPVLDCLEATLGEVANTDAHPARIAAPSIGLGAELAAWLSPG
jgi:Asp/Glu/hydantoin racemase